MLVVYVDGIVFGDYHVLAAVGVDATGRRHVLGLRGRRVWENATVATALREELVERGLRADRRRLFVIDGAKALRSTIGHVFACPSSRETPSEPPSGGRASGPRPWSGRAPRGCAPRSGRARPRRTA